jgi:hypothetical protein
VIREDLNRGGSRNGNGIVTKMLETFDNGEEFLISNGSILLKKLCILLETVGRHRRWRRQTLS